MKIIKLALLVVAFISQITVYASYAPKVEISTLPNVTKSSTACETIQECVLLYSEKYNVPESILSRIIYCESGNNIYAKNVNKKEKSYGPVQINLLAHPSITYEQATNPAFAVEFLAKNYDNAPQMWYTCYRKAIQAQ